MISLNLRNKKTICLILLVLAAAAVALSPCLRCGFTNWDDPAYVTQNKDIKNFSWAGAGKLCSYFYNANYHPLTMLSYLVDYRFFKLNPIGFHSTSLILHLLNCLLVFWFIFKLANSNITAFVAAALFSVHPLCVEPVVWISSRKDILYTLFFLFSLISYLYYLDKQKRIYYYLSFLGFSFSLLSKVMAVALPFVLLLIDYLKGRNIDKKLIMEKIIFFELSMIFLAIGIFAQFSYATMIQSGLLTIGNRALIGAYAVIFYLSKIAWPFGLSCQYPYPRIAELTSFGYLIAPLIIVFLAISVITLSRYTRKIMFGALFFLVIVLPVLQLIPAGNSFAADRYVYLASLGFFYLAGEGARYLYLRISRFARLGKPAAIIMFIVLLLGLSVLSWQRCKVWTNSVFLWSDVLEKYPNSPIAYNNRADAYVSEGRYDLAIEDCIRAISITPNYASAYFTRGSAYRAKGDYSKAGADFKRYLEMNFQVKSK